MRQPLLISLALIATAAAVVTGSAPARSDRASDRATCTAADVASYDLRFCLRSRALTRKQRLAVVARALEHGRGAQAVDALEALRHGAFDDDKQVRQAIVLALAELDVVAAEAMASVPGRATLEQKLRALLKHNSADIRKLRAEDCQLHASEPQDRTAVIVTCRRFVRCDKCSERWARAELVAAGKTLRLKSAKVSDESHGMCSDCP